MKYVTYDDAGSLTGAYDQDLLPEHEFCHIEVTEDVRLNWNAYQANPDRDGLEPAPVTTPAVGVPKVISKFQAKAALLQAGLLDQAEALVADSSTPAIVKLAWKEVQEFWRDSPMIASMAQLLGWSSEMVDGLFIAGAGIAA